ncbi:ParA family protein [Bacillus cereus group sp. Bc061]|uniref:ParA family protein n=1 Tax=Bacillus cereus group sp. Bc061 TaxID=3018117 RepID=UPI0022DE997F|nr:ParA family protein [Bacillus cereus group sp. Bc061]MDA2595561.1 ParA family protein [Bacillus cereus group sp. Bc061]
MGHVITFLNMKGGVGKTTLCKEIGYYLASRGERVLLIDVDPQANLTQSIFKKYKYKHTYERESEENKNFQVCTSSINMVFNQSYIEKAGKENVILDLSEKLSIIPGDLNTVFLERTLGGSEQEQALKNFIEDFNLTDDFKYILLDCPPTYSFYTTAALLASDFYVSPIYPDSYSVLGLDLLFKAIDKLKSVHRDRFRYRPISQIGVIFSNMARKPTPGVQNFMSDIFTSKELKEKGIYFFENHFVKNSHIPKDVGYFIVDGENSISKMNIQVIVEEFDERIMKLCPQDTVNPA